MHTRVGQHGHERLMRDLDAVEFLLAKRPGATKRLQRELGPATVDGLIASLAHSRSPAPAGTRTSRSSRT